MKGVILINPREFSDFTSLFRKRNELNSAAKRKDVEVCKILLKFEDDLAGDRYKELLAWDCIVIHNLYQISKDKDEFLGRLTYLIENGTKVLLKSPDHYYPFMFDRADLIRLELFNSL